MKRFYFLSIILISFFSIQAQDKTVEKKISNPEPAVSEGSAIIANKSVKYSTTTGYLALSDKDGVQKANMFYVAYIKQNEAGTPKSSDELKTRPITFVFNGGPGSASVWLHLGALGPKKIAMNAEGNAKKAPYAIENNEYSWLDLTDLVFIDPVGTGFSKPVEGEKPEQFYGFDNDVKAVSDFIRLWTNQNNRWGSPKFLVGESYGTTRACGVVDYLMNEYQMYFNGITLISCALDFQTLREYEGNDMPYICNLPVYTKAAQYHKVLPQWQIDDKDLIKQAEEFAMTDYATALLKGDLLSTQEKMEVAKKLSFFTGISVEEYMKANLRIPTYKFRKILLDTSNVLIGRYDVRLTMPDPVNYSDYASEAPSCTQISGAFGTAFNEYVRNDLKYTNNLPFYVIGNVSPWKFGDGKYLNVTGQLRNAMFTNPYMKVYIANGTYDLATSYFGTQYSLNHMALPAQLKKNILVSSYEGGHMMYFLEDELKKLKLTAVSMYMQK